MLDPETLKLAQEFLLGLVQNLIGSLIVEGKKIKDDNAAKKTIAFLDRYEHSKPLDERIVRAVNAALLKLNPTLSQDELRLLLPLAFDPVFGGELARQILNDSYSPEKIALSIVQASGSTLLHVNQVIGLASLLEEAIQNAIADDPHLHRTKELRFQRQITNELQQTEVKIQETQEAVRQTGNIVIQAVTQQLQQICTAQRLYSDKTNELDIRERIYSDRVTQARKLLESGKPKTARVLLEELRAEISHHNSSKALLFKIATNIGSCAIQLGDHQTAIREIELASQLDPENPKAITNLSATTLLKGQPNEALQLAKRARELLPQDSIATANYVQALFELDRDIELQPLIDQEDWITKDPHCCFVIGTLLFNRNRFAEAEKFFTSGLVANPTEPRLLASLAHTLLRPMQNALMGQPLLDWKIPSDAIQLFKRAEDLLNQAIAVQQHLEDRHFFALAHVLRADARRMLGKDAAAIADCDIALHENPSDDSPLPIKAHAQLHARRIDEAIITFEQITTPEAKRCSLLPLAISYNATKKPQKAVELLSPHWNNPPNEVVQLKIADQLLWAYSQLGNTSSANAIISKLHSTWPQNPDALSAVAHYRRHQGNTAEAVGLLSEALAYTSGSPRDLIALELAEIHYERNDFSKAADLYETVADLTKDNELSTKYLLCLYNSGSRKETLTLAQTLRGSREPVPVISQIEANILAEIGDLKTAQQIMERLSQLHPKLHAYHITSAVFAMRQGRHADARNILEQIPYQAIEGPATILLQAARLRAVLGIGDALALAYRARRVGFTSPEIHAGYVMLFLSRDQVDSVDLAKEVVDDDCSVILQISDERRAYTILTESVLHSERGEISPGQAASMQLLGKRKGDRFCFNRDAFGNNIDCVVVDVQSKYVRAFQETLVKFPAMFPMDRTLQGISGSYEKVRDGLLRQLDEQHTDFRRIAGLYEARRATFESFAGVLRCSPIDLWGLLIGGAYCSFASFSGAASEAHDASHTASEAESILLDLTAILTFGELGLLDRLAKRYKLFTIQPVLDVLVESHAKAALSKPGLRVGKIGDNYVKEQTTAEQVLAHKVYLERILRFLSENVTTLPVPSLLESNDLSPELREVLGPISTSSILAARETGHPLYSEDQMLRTLGRNEWKIRGIFAQAILQELVSRTIITDDECIEATSRLFLMNFSVVPIGPDNIMWALRKVDYRITDDVKRMFSIFHGPECTFESAISVLSETTKRVWLENPLYHQKMDLLDGMLDAIGTNRAKNQVARHFTYAIQSRMRLLPNASDSISERVHLWRDRELGRGGIIIPAR